MTKAKRDWTMIRVEYEQGIRSNLAISRQFNVPESTIRKKAKEEGWVKQQTKAKRLKVSNAIAQGKLTIEPMEFVPEPEQQIDTAANADIKDMNDAVENARMILAKVKQLTPIVLEPRDVKALVEANKSAVETIRKVRGLDEEQGGSYEEALEAMAAGLV